MTTAVYATPDQLAAWLGTDAPPNAGMLLRHATFVIAKACNPPRNPYADTPTEAETVPLADATCAQAAQWITLGIDPAAAGLDTAPVKSSSIGGDQVDLDTTGQTAGLPMAASDLAPLASDILYAAGLLYVPVPLGADPADQLPRWGLDSPRGYGYGYGWPTGLDGLPDYAGWPFQ